MSDRHKSTEPVRDPAEARETPEAVLVAALPAWGPIVPATMRPLSAGRPRPEPEERWTLGPERKAEPGEPAGESSDELVVEPTRPARTGR